MSEEPGPTLRLGVMGCGRVFQRFHLPAITRIPAVSLRAGCDINPNRLTWLERLPSPPATFGTPAELLDSGLDAVLVLTPPPSHAENVIRALEAGVHVMVEKPMALDPGEARRMAQAARAARRHLQVGFTRRFRQPYQKLRGALDQIDSRRIRQVHFDLAFPTSSWRAESDFLGQEAQGGGVLDDVLSHQVDLICWLLQARPYRVRCKVGGRDAETSTELEIGSVTVHCKSAHSRYVELLELVLEDGALMEASGSHMGIARGVSQRWRRNRARLRDKASLVRDRLLRRPTVTLRSFEGQLRDFVGAIRGAKPIGATAEDGVLSVQIVHACRMSSQQGGTWQDLPTPAG